MLRSLKNNFCFEIDTFNTLKLKKVIFFINLTNYFYFKIIDKCLKSTCYEDPINIILVIIIIVKLLIIILCIPDGLE